MEPGFTIFSPDGMPPDSGAIEQMENVMRDERAVSGALMADHHKGYSMPIGGVVAYEDAVSPTGVGFDIGCGNKAVRSKLNISDFNIHEYAQSQKEIYDTFKPFMRLIQKQVSFGLGRSNAEKVDHELFDDPLWTEISQEFGRGLKDKARDQLGTVGSGNHYVDVLVDEADEQIWFANHFGSRGLGHTIASGFMARAAGQKFTDRVPESEDAVVLSTKEDLGAFYTAAMSLAGEYAYAGRDYVIDQVCSIFGTGYDFAVHNHHNFAWEENGLWVVRKGATPLTTEPAFIGGSMGDISVIVRGQTPYSKFRNEHPYAMYNPADWLGERQEVEDIGNLNSAPHGAGRVMSRTKAAGKMRKFWLCPNRNCQAFKERAEANKPASVGSRCPKCGIVLRKMRMRDESTAAIKWDNVRESLTNQGIVVLGAGADESPGVYKPLKSVLAAHDNIEILHTLHPLGVVMAGDDTRDPYKD
jgi:tRNA-splicing ligase RtcB (3'-phosphate/5'-hydroxy nucleic acid ligase)